MELNFFGGFSNDAVISKACTILEERLSYRVTSDKFTSPQESKQYLVLKLAEREAEVFCCMFMDNRNRLISFDEMFNGTVDGARIYPREVVKAALLHNAAAVICAHNHPSGVPEPSSADIQITRKLQEALQLVDVRLLDHIIVGGTDTVSLAERGCL